MQAWTSFIILANIEIFQAAPANNEGDSANLND